MSVLAVIALWAGMSGSLNSLSAAVPAQGAAALSGATPPKLKQVASKVLVVEGRSVTLSVDLWRDLMPVIGGSGGGLITAVSFSTADRRGLPGITDLKVTFVRSTTQTWKPRLLAVQTFRYDPQNAMYSAGGGPKWSLNSRVTARVEFKSGGRTRRVDIPVRVAGVY
jgi:hypothetical protein